MANVPARQGERVQYEPGELLVGATGPHGAVPTESMTDPESREHPRVLVVEPAAGPRSLATLVLAADADPWKVREAGTPLEFAEGLADAAFDIVVIALDPGWARTGEIAAAARRRRPGCLCFLFGAASPDRLAAECGSAGLDGWLPQDPRGFVELPGRLRALWRARRTGTLRGISATLAHDLPLALFTLDPAGRLTAVNEACRSLLDCAPDDGPVGVPLDRYLDAAGENAWRLLQGRGAGTAIVGLRRAHGPPASVRVCIAPLSAGQSGGGTEGYLEPIGEASGDAGRARQTLADVAYALAHDLQEPLRHARQFSGLLREHLGGRLDPEGERLLSRVTASVARVQDLNDGVIEYLLAGNAAAATTTGLRAVVDAAIAALSDSLDEAGGSVVCGLLPDVAGDATRLASVFQNLIANSLRYRSTEPPVIEITARREGSGWTVAVRDNGIGIEPRDHERIFGMFQRLHRDPGRSGTGIGLALCRRILESMGARITVESAPGRGATFLLRFPDPGAGPVAATDRSRNDCGRR